MVAPKPAALAPGAGRSTLGVLSFKRPKARAAPDNRWTMRDRMTLADWQTAASGVGRLQSERAEPGDDPDIGEFLLLYRPGALWAQWGLAPRDGACELWCMSTGQALGVYSGVADALAALG